MVPPPPAARITRVRRARVLCLGRKMRWLIRIGAAYSLTRPGTSSTRATYFPTIADRRRDRRRLTQRVCPHQSVRRALSLSRWWSRACVAAAHDGVFFADGAYQGNERCRSPIGPEGEATMKVNEPKSAVASPPVGGGTQMERRPRLPPPLPRLPPPSGCPPMKPRIWIAWSPAPPRWRPASVPCGCKHSPSRSAPATTIPTSRSSPTKSSPRPSSTPAWQKISTAGRRRRKGWAPQG